jgi:hypothetical protein
LHFHDLRHEAISRFFDLGLNAHEVALISGYEDMRMLFRYTQPLRAAAIEKLDRQISSSAVRTPKANFLETLVFEYCDTRAINIEPPQGDTHMGRRESE